MAVISELKEFIGKWKGTKRLWFEPGGPVHESESQAAFQPIADDQFFELRYTWSYEEVAQEGRLIFGRESSQGAINAVWFDTWHMRDQFMVCKGSIEEDQAMSVTGSYPAPPGPDWGWQITIEPGGSSEFRFLMYNISPEGEKMLAVEVNFVRRD